MRTGDAKSFLIGNKTKIERRTTSDDSMNGYQTYYREDTGRKVRYPDGLDLRILAGYQTIFDTPVWPDNRYAAIFRKSR